MTSDTDLYKAWAEGDTAAATTLVQRHIAQVGRFFSNKVADAMDTEDLVARTFEICAQKLGSFRGDSRFRTYLFGIAHNVLRDYVKRRSRQPDLDFEITMIKDIAPSPSVVVGERKEQTLLLEAMRSIPVAYQVALELAFFEELTQAEIAELLGVPPGTVASRIRRGKQQLLERLEALADTRELLDSTLSSLADWSRSIRKLLGKADGEPANDG